MRSWERAAALRAARIDYNQKAQYLIRDTFNDGKVIFAVDVYGWDKRDAYMIPGGSEPARRAIERLGLDPNRYMATIWDVS